MEEKLDRSHHLIVLASRQAKTSAGMEFEAHYWYSKPRAGQTIILVTDGEYPDWDSIRADALPPTLREKMKSTPLWIDISPWRSRIAITSRPALVKALHEELRQLVLLFYPGKTWSELLGEERAQRRRALRLVWAAVLSLSLITAIAVAMAYRAQHETVLANLNAQTAQRNAAEAVREAGIADQQRQEALRQSVIANDQAKIAEEQRDQALARLLASDSVLAQRSSVDTTVPALVGIESLLRAETPQGYEALWEAGAVLAHEVTRKSFPLKSGQDGIFALAFSPNSLLVATASGDGTARVFESHTGHDLWQAKYQGPVYAVSFSPDGTLIAIGAYDNTVRILQARTGSEVARFSEDEKVQAVHFSPDGALVATGSRVFELHSGREVARLTTHNPNWAVAFSPDGGLVATGSFTDTAATISDTHTGGQVARLVHPDMVSALAFSPNGMLVATGSEKAVVVFDAHSWRELVRLKGHGSEHALAFSPDGTLLATDQQDGPRVFDARTGEEVAHLSQQGFERALAFSPDGALVAAGSDDGTTRVFEARTGHEIFRLINKALNPSARPMAVAFSPDGTLVVSGDNANNVRVVKARSQRELSRLNPQVGVSTASFSPDGSLLATISNKDEQNQWEDTARVFDVETGREVFHLPQDQEPVQISAVGFSPDNALVALGLQKLDFDVKSGSIVVKPGAKTEMLVLVYEVRTAREVARLEFEDQVAALALSPGGALAAVIESDDLLNRTRVFDLRTRHQVSQLANNVYDSAVAFSPDGKLVATCLGDNTVTIFEARTGHQVVRIRQPLQPQFLSPPNTVAFSPDGALIAAGTDGNMGWVFEARTGREVARLTHQDTVGRVVFSADGTLVATVEGITALPGSKGHTMRVFEANTGREVARVPLEQLRGISFAPGGNFLRAVRGERDLQVTQDPLHSPELIKEACSNLERNLTRDEWADYLGELPYRESCQTLNRLAQSKQK